MIAKLLLCTLLTAAVNADAQAPATPTMARASAAPAPVTLGPRFSGPFDVSFKPFADATPAERQDLNQIARFEHKDKKWTLEFNRRELPMAMTLKDKIDASGRPVAGYLSQGLNQLRAQEPSADVLRSEAIELGDLKIGVIIARATAKSGPILLQEALIEVQPRLFYWIVMTSPGAGEKLEKTPELQEASDTFRAILDSVEKVDLSGLRKDQDERLFRTRALFVEWNKKKLLSALQPARMLRYRQDGKDIGYAYIVEQAADAIPREGETQKNIGSDPDKAAGLRVGLRVHMVDKDGKIFETEKWMFVTYDRRHEVWSAVTVVNDPAQANEKLRRTWLSQVGASDLKKVFDPTLKPDDFKDFDAKNRAAGAEVRSPFEESDRYQLVVREEGQHAVGEPMHKDLPVFYIPQALGALLPRIVPLKSPTGYLFGSYNNENHQIMLRYVDVQSERDIVLDKKNYRAVPVVDKLGYDGTPTTYYLSPAGELLGAVNEVDKIEILPTDEATLLKIWKDATLAQPGVMKPE